MQKDKIPAPQISLYIKIVWQTAATNLEKGSEETGNQRKCKMSLRKKIIWTRIQMIHFVNALEGTGNVSVNY